MAWRFLTTARAKETLEHVGGAPRWYWDSSVRDDDFCPSISLGNRDLDSTAGPVVFDCIVHQIFHDYRDGIAIDQNRPLG
jgi:hypothetical protein